MSNVSVLTPWEAYLAACEAHKLAEDQIRCRNNAMTLRIAVEPPGVGLQRTTTDQYLRLDMTEARWVITQLTRIFGA